MADFLDVIILAGVAATFLAVYFWYTRIWSVFAVRRQSEKERRWAQAFGVPPDELPPLAEDPWRAVVRLCGKALLLCVMTWALWFVAWRMWGDGQRAQTNHSLTLAEQYPGPWREEFDLEITHALRAHSVRGCGLYVYRSHVNSANAHLVYCQGAGSDTWVAYEVRLPLRSVIGPLPPDPGIPLPGQMSLSSVQSRAEPFVDDRGSFDALNQNSLGRRRELAWFSMRAAGVQIAITAVKNVPDEAETLDLVAYGINLNGHLCARVTAVRPMKRAGAYEVECIESRGGRTTRTYVVHAERGEASILDWIKP